MAEFTVTATTTIDGPVDQVWELVSDARRYHEWVVATDEVTRADHPLAVGATYEERNTVLGPIKGKSRWTVTEFDAPRRQVHSGEGIPIASRLEVIMETRDAGGGRTEFTLTLAGASGLGPVGVLALPLLKRNLDAENRRSVANFAKLAAGG